MADNPTRKFKFVSPGVFIDEIDNSQVPTLPTEVGPLVIGRARRGPANIPVTVESFSDFGILYLPLASPDLVLALCWRPLPTPVPRFALPWRPLGQP